MLQKLFLSTHAIAAFAFASGSIYKPHTEQQHLKQGNIHRSDFQPQSVS